MKEVDRQNRLYLGKNMIRIAKNHGMTVCPCGEGDELAAYGADCTGCMTERRSDSYSRTEKLDRWSDAIVRLDGDYNMIRVRNGIK